MIVVKHSGSKFTAMREAIYISTRPFNPGLEQSCSILSTVHLHCVAQKDGSNFIFIRK